jgi:hypothetical protein
MKRRAIATLAGLTVTLLAGLGGWASDDPDVVVFYREGSSEWMYTDRLLLDVQTQYPGLTVQYIEASEPTADLLWDLARHYGIFPARYPVIFVGQEAIVGTGYEKEVRLRSAVRGCVAFGCASPLSHVRGPSIPWRTYLVVGLAAVMLLLVYLE